MFKKFFSAVFITLLLVCLGEKTDALENQKRIKLVNNGCVAKYKTNSETVKEFLLEQNIKISSQDNINFDLSHELKDNTLIEIKRNFVTRVLIDDQENFVCVKYGDKLNELINSLSLKHNKNFICDLNLDTMVQDAPNLKIMTHEVKPSERNEIVNFETKTILTDKLLLGDQKIIQAGSNGKKLILEDVVYISGKECSRTLKSQKIISKPITQIISKGTRKSNFDQKYKNALIMNASAYTAGFESTGKHPGDKNYGITATGARACHGSVAVDPKIIPLGTKLFVENYGYAKACDTGSSIKGDKIDLFYDNLCDAKKFGRRNLIVYILD